MLNRRSFVQGGIVVSALAMNSLVRAAPYVTREKTIALHKVVVDSGARRATVFGSEIYRYGIPVQQIDNDLTRLWYDDLRPLWKVKPLAIGGLTSASSMHCLEMLALRERAHIIYRASHSYSSVLRHDVEMDSDLPLKNMQRGSDVAQVEWELTAAHQLINQSYNRAGNFIRKEPADVAQDDAQGEEKLFSWIIAPVRLV